MSFEQILTAATLHQEETLSDLKRKLKTLDITENTIIDLQGTPHHIIRTPITTLAEQNNTDAVNLLLGFNCEPLHAMMGYTMSDHHDALITLLEKYPEKQEAFAYILGKLGLDDLAHTLITKKLITPDVVLKGALAADKTQFIHQLISFYQLDPYEVIKAYLTKGHFEHALQYSNSTDFDLLITAGIETEAPEAWYQFLLNHYGKCSSLFIKHCYLKHFRKSLHQALEKHPQFINDYLVLIAKHEPSVFEKTFKRYENNINFNELLKAFILTNDYAMLKNLSYFTKVFSKVPNNLLAITSLELKQYNFLIELLKAMSYQYENKTELFNELAKRVNSGLVLKILMDYGFYNRESLLLAMIDNQKISVVEDYLNRSEQLDLDFSVLSAIAPSDNQLQLLQIIARNKTIQSLKIKWSIYSRINNKSIIDLLYKNHTLTVIENNHDKDIHKLLQANHALKIINEKNEGLIDNDTLQTYPTLVQNKYFISHAEALLEKITIEDDKDNEFPANEFPADETQDQCNPVTEETSQDNVELNDFLNKLEQLLKLTSPIENKCEIKPVDEACKSYFIKIAILLTEQYQMQEDYDNAWRILKYAESVLPNESAFSEAIQTILSIKLEIIDKKLRANANSQEEPELLKTKFELVMEELRYAVRNNHSILANKLVLTLLGEVNSVESTAELVEPESLGNTLVNVMQHIAQKDPNRYQLFKPSPLPEPLPPTPDQSGTPDQLKYD